MIEKEKLFLLIGDMKKILLFFCLVQFFISSPAFSQSKKTAAVQFREDSLSGRPVQDVLVYHENELATISNEEGICLIAPRYAGLMLRTSHLSYESKTYISTFTGKTQIIILRSKAYRLRGVTVFDHSFLKHYYQDMDSIHDWQFQIQTAQNWEIEKIRQDSLFKRNSQQIFVDNWGKDSPASNVIAHPFAYFSKKARRGRRFSRILNKHQDFLAKENKRNQLIRKRLKPQVVAEILHISPEEAEAFIRWSQDTDTLLNTDQKSFLQLLWQDYQFYCFQKQQDIPIGQIEAVKFLKE
ncbi:MAG: hypothetical protein MI784_02955 [Cytophagales bacterium]|nr:hypothetical protein [Cytophagales bacterium]